MAQAPKVIGRPFQPGQSGNPGGRPKSQDHVRNLARQHSTRALLKLIELTASSDERVALAASKEILDRAFGRPKPEPDASEGPLQINIVRYSQ